MKDRIHFISHKDKKILLVDRVQFVTRRIGGTACRWLCPGSRPSPEVRSSFWRISRGAQFDKKGVEAIKPALVIDRPYLKRSAWVGTENLPKVFYETPEDLFAARLTVVPDAEEALDWLVED